MQNDQNNNLVPAQERRIGINVLDARRAAKASTPAAIDRQFERVTDAIKRACDDGKTFTVIDEDMYPETFDALADAGFRLSTHGCNGAVIRWDSELPCTPKTIMKGY